MRNTSSLKKAVDFSQNTEIEKIEQLKERVLGYKNIIWDICKRTYEVTAYRNYLIKLNALGFTEEEIYEEEMYGYRMEAELREEDEDEWGRLSTSIGFPEEEREERTKY